MSFEDADLVAEFIVESNEHLADVENQLLTIEASGADIDVDLVNTVFRAVHSVKGVAGFLGYETINRLAHSLESVLNQIRNLELIPTTEIVDLLLRASDQLRDLVNNIDDSNTTDVSAHITSLDKVAANQGEVPTPEPNNMPQNNLPQEADEASLAIQEDAIQEDQHQEELKDPSLDQDHPIPSEEEQMLAPNEESSNNEAEMTSAAAPTSKGAPPVPADTSIRVSVSTLDHLMNSAGELVLNRNRLLQVSANSADSGLASVAASLDQVTSDLQEVIMETRMQPVGNVFSRFPRVVRDLSAKLQKQCDLTLEGTDVEVDKSIIEAIGDPLTHLVRNAVDHGIEMPEDRIAKGKNPKGTVRLMAYHQAGKVCIDIKDDGNGLDAEKLKKKAISKGFITAEVAAEMSHKEAIRLIFHPGFSTAAKVSDVSGRGVGMDVVRTNVEKLGGAVDVQSVMGKGSTIHIVLPLTLAIIPSLVVESGNSRFAVPQVNILELVRATDGESERSIGRVMDAEVLRLRGELLPLVRLDKVLDYSAPDAISDETKEASSDELPEASKKKSNHILVVESGQLRYGLVVDQLLDSEEIVVKPLGHHLKNCKTLAGATILGDGRIAWILDITGIAARAELNMNQGSDNEDETTNELEEKDQQTLLLFNVDPKEQFAVPMSIVTRIERIQTKDINCIGNSETVLYRGGTLPLLSLDKSITALPRPDSEYMNVVLFQVAGHEAGIIAPTIQDIRDVSTNVDMLTLQEPGVIGSLVIDDQTTRILDVYRIAEIMHPEWFVDRAPVEQAEDVSTTMLVVEDSNFFRRQVVSFLKELGYSIVEAEDGQVAWDILQSQEHEFCLVVSDIEMPNMNGFELCERIKTNPAHQHLPVIALTSLSSENDQQRGKDCGVDDYMVKMDQDTLRNSITRLLNNKSRAQKKVHSQTPELVGCGA